MSGEGTQTHAAARVWLLAVVVIFLSACSEREFRTADKPSSLFNYSIASSQNVQTRAVSPLPGIHPVTVNTHLLNVTLDQAVTVNLADGREFAAIFQRKFNHANGDVTVTGFLRDFGVEYAVVITYGVDGAFGRIQTPQGLLYLRCDSSGTWLVDTVASGLIPRATVNDALIPPPKLRASTSYKPEAKVTARAGVTTIVDVLVMYSSALKTKYSATALQTRLNELFALTNKGFTDSQVDLQIRLVFTSEVTFDETTTSEAALALLSGNAAPFNGVAQLRDQYGADMVVFLRPFKAGANISCGVSWLNGANSSSLSPTSAFSVVAEGQDPPYFCDDFTLAHELAHGMGSSHDIANADGPGVYPYSYGYGKQDVFGTIMSYFTPQAGRFSNPNISTCFNNVCGVAEQSDNARSLNNVRDTVAAFRSTVTSARSLPVVSTNAATQIGANGATLNATVDASGLASELNFEYGDTPSVFTKQTVKRAVVATAKSLSVSQPISGLVCGKTYYFRAVANNVDGVAQGAAQSFTTRACAQASVSSVSVPRVEILGLDSVNVITQVKTQSAVTVYFEYGIDNTFGSKTVEQQLAADADVSASISGLACGATYSVKAVAVASATDIQTSAAQTFTLGACNPVLPAISPPTIKSVGDTSASVEVDIDANGAATQAWLEFGTTAALGNQSVEVDVGGSTEPVTVLLNITGLTCSTTYQFRVKAKNTSGSAQTELAQFTTASCPPVIAIVTDAAIGIGQTGVSLTAQVAPHDQVMEVYFEYGIASATDNRGRSISLPSNTAGISVNEFVSGLVCGETYQYRAVAVSASGTTSGEIKDFTTLGCATAATAIVTLDPTGITSDAAKLRGSVNTQGKPTVVYFEYGETTEYGTVTPKYSVGSPITAREATWNISNLLCGTLYHYRAVAIIENGTPEGLLSSGGDVAFSTDVCKPLSFRDTAVLWSNNTSASIISTVVTNGAPSDVYLEYGETNAYGTKTELVKVASGTVTFQLLNLTCNTAYYFRLVGANINGGVVDNENTFTTKACALPPNAVTEAAIDVGSTTAKLVARVNPNGAQTSVYFDYGVDPQRMQKTTPQIITSGFSDQIFSQDVGNLACNVNYSVRVIASSVNGSSTGELLSFTTASCQPEQVNTPPTATLQITSGSAHNLAVDDGGRILSWGNNELGQLGMDPATTTRFQAVQDSAGATISGALRVTAGGKSSFALLGSGEILAWGDNNQGQLGTGDKTATSIPKQVLSDGGGAVFGAVDVAAGEKHALALLMDGSVRAWGVNDMGQIGNNQKNSRSEAVAVTNVINAIDIVAGANHSLALIADGSLLAWGDNRFGQLGDGSTNIRIQPVRIDTDLAQIAAGAKHSLGISTNGIVMSWGANENGQLGLGDVNGSLVPQQVIYDGAPLTRVKAIAAGKSHSLALLEDGRVLAWGDNSLGQLGDGTTTKRNYPQLVLTSTQQALTRIVAIAAGDSHSVAVTETGNVVAWGDNQVGQLGEQLTLEKSSLFPTVVKDNRGSTVSLRIPRILVDPPTSTIREGERTVFQLRLSSPPDQSTTVTVRVGDNEPNLQVIGGGEFTFTKESWDKNQQVTVRAVADTDTRTSRGSLLFSATGIPTLSVNVTIEEGRVLVKAKGVGAIEQLLVALLMFVAAWRVSVYRRNDRRLRTLARLTSHSHNCRCATHTPHNLDLARRPWRQSESCRQQY